MRNAAVFYAIIIIGIVSFTEINAQTLQLVGSYDSPGLANGVMISGSYAYLADYSGGLRIIDVSNPASPSPIGWFDASDNVDAVFVRGGYAYVAAEEAGLYIIDISDPANPFQTGHYTTIADAVDVYVLGNYAYVACYLWGLQIINISNPYSPVYMSGYDSYGEARGIHVAGSTAYLADGHEGVVYINVSDPANPVWDDGTGSPDANDVFVQGNYLYVANYAYLEIYDLTLISYPRLCLLSIPYGTYGICASGSFAFIPIYYFGNYVYDVSDPRNPQYCTSVDLGSCPRGAAVSGDYIYFADGNCGLNIYHLTYACQYIAGDINGNGQANGIDVGYGVSYLKGGPPPPVLCQDCPEVGQNLYAAGDVNGSCSFNGIDISYFVTYLKGGPGLQYCSSCPPTLMAQPPAPAIVPADLPVTKIQ